jgi:hypothetical protein
MTPQDAIAALWPQVVAVLGIRPTGAGDQ